MRRFPLCPVCKPCLAPAPLFLQIGGRFPAVHKGVSMSRHESVHPEHAGFSHNLLDFEKEIFCPSIRAAMEHGEKNITPLFDNLERATKISWGWQLFVNWLATIKSWRVVVHRKISHLR